MHRAFFSLILIATAVNSTVGQVPGLEGRGDSELGSVRVTVTDPLDRFVVGLKADDFRLFEGGDERRILHFQAGAFPISTGILLDLGEPDKEVLSEFVEFLKEGDRNDQYLISSFNQNRYLQDVNRPATGRSVASLWEAVRLSLEKVQEGEHERKALIVVSYRADVEVDRVESESLAREFDSQVYLIAIGQDLGRLGQLVRLSGGRSFHCDDRTQIGFALESIRTELRNQYLATFRTLTDESVTQRGEIRVSLDPPAGMPTLTVRHKVRLPRGE